MIGEMSYKHQQKARFHNRKPPKKSETVEKRICTYRTVHSLPVALYPLRIQNYLSPPLLRTPEVLPLTPVTTEHHHKPCCYTAVLTWAQPRFCPLSHSCPSVHISHARFRLNCSLSKSHLTVSTPRWRQLTF